MFWRVGHPVFRQPSETTSALKEIDNTIPGRNGVTPGGAAEGIVLAQIFSLWTR
jgi:hypothetical protein